MKLKPFPTAVIIVLLMTISLSLGLSPNGEGAETDPRDPYTPLILSEHQDNKVLRLYSPPSPSITILYDRWTFIIFGNVNDTYRLKINGAEAFNGTMDREYLNLSYNAMSLDRARVEMKIGNRTYLWSNIIVNHREMSLDGVLPEDADKKYSRSDLLREKLKTGFGVILSTIITIPFIWMGVRAWRNRQGVVQW